jgi:cystathionine beta-synthase
VKLNSILESIGGTPLVKINRLFTEFPLEVYAKCEFLNPGGSVKDRIGYQMVADAEKSGRIKKGDTLIEPTSGNAGIGIALAGAVMGYRVIITMPQKMSKEKQVVLEALGAEIVRTPTEAAWDDPESHISIAKVLQTQIPNSHILDQYSNASNPNAHSDFTATEIVNDLGKVPDYVFAGAGTGGTISGIAKKLKSLSKTVKIIGIDPVGSILGGGSHVASYHVEGIGYDFFPKVLNTGLVDDWVKTTDEPSFVYARRAVREEGLLCGGSCGSALSGFAQYASKIPKGSTVVIILPDGVRNYMSKHLDNAWLAEHNFSKAQIPVPTFAAEVLEKYKKMQS